MGFNLIEADIIGGQLGPPESGLFPTTHSRAAQPALTAGPSTGRGWRRAAHSLLAQTREARGRKNPGTDKEECLKGRGERKEMKTTLFPKQGCERACESEEGAGELSHFPVPCWSGRAPARGCGRKENGMSPGMCLGAVPLRKPSGTVPGAVAQGLPWPPESLHAAAYPQAQHDGGTGWGSEAGLGAHLGLGRLPETLRSAPPDPSLPW